MEGDTIGRCAYKWFLDPSSIFRWRGGTDNNNRGEWMRGLGLGFTNPVGIDRVLDVCLCLGCGGVGGEWVGDWTRSGGVVLCLCDL